MFKQGHTHKILPCCTNTKKRLSRAAKGQSLVEYALILVLVSVGVIAAAFLIGSGIKRIYAVITGSLGTQYHTTSGQDDFDISDGSQFCVWYPPNSSVASAYPNGVTALDLRGSNRVPIETLSLSTDTGKFYKGGGSEFHADFNGGWLVSAILDPNKGDPSLCPKTVVVQANNGQVAIATVKVAARN